MSSIAKISNVGIGNNRIVRKGANFGQHTQPQSGRYEIRAVKAGVGVMKFVARGNEFGAANERALEVIRRFIGKSGLADEIARAKRLTELEPDWDDNGSGPFLKAHVEAVGKFLTTLEAQAQMTFSASIPVPRITAGPPDAIDVTWRPFGGTLLLTVPADITVPAAFYGHYEPRDAAKRSVKGYLDINSDNLWLATWLLGK